MVHQIIDNQEIVSIAFCIDSKYIQHLTVTLYSICDNLARGRLLNVYIIHNSLLQAEQDRLIADITIFTNVQLFFVHDTNEYNELAVDSKITQSVYLKINLSETLPKNLNKILYIDSDIIATGDIGELYDLNPRYLMAVKDTNLYLEKYYDILFGVSNKNGYFNAGVMLMNLSALRQIDAAKNIMEYSIKYSNMFHWHDQTGFNYFLHDKYEQIHPKYNLLQCAYSLRNMKQSIYSKIEYITAKSNPVLIHYAGSTYKPWKYETIGPYKYLYFTYIQKTSYKDFVLHKSLSKIRQRYWNYILLYMLPTILIGILSHIQGRIFLHKNQKNSKLIHKLSQEIKK